MRFLSTGTVPGFFFFSYFIPKTSTISGTCCAVLSHVQLFVTPVDCSPPGSSVHRDSPGKNTGVGCHALLQGNLPWSPALQMGSLLSEPPGKPSNPGVGSLSLLQGIFLTQELNQGLLHCRQILYQLSYQGSLNTCLLKALMYSLGRRRGEEFITKEQEETLRGDEYTLSWLCWWCHGHIYKPEF